MANMLESAFNKEHSLIARRIIRLLSTDARISKTALSRRLGLSRPNIAVRLEKLQEHFGIKYTLELSAQDIGFDSPHIIVARFRKKPKPEVLQALLSKSYIPQIAITTKGDYDLIVYAVAKSLEEYAHWDREMRRELMHEYGMEWRQSEVMYNRLGFFPLRNEAIQNSALPDKDRRMLKLLNEDARIPFKELSSSLGMNYKTTIYNFARVSKKYVKRFTISMDLQKNISLLALFSNYVPPKDFKRAAGITERFFTDDDENALVNRYLITASSIGSYEFFALGAFDDHKTAMEYGVQQYKRMYNGFETLEVKTAEIKEVILGRLPIRSVDVKSAYAKAKITE